MKYQLTDKVLFNRIERSIITAKKDFSSGDIQYKLDNDEWVHEDDENLKPWKEDKKVSKARQKFAQELIDSEEDLLIDDDSDDTGEPSGKITRNK